MKKSDKETASKKYNPQALNKHPNSKRNQLWILFRDLLLFGLFLFLIGIFIALIFILILGLNWLFANYLIVLYIFGYPSLLGALIVWVKVFRKQNLRLFLLGLPKMPEKGHRWLFIVLFLGGLALLIENLILFCIGAIWFRTVGIDFWLLFIATVFGAGIVEEFFFRGYLYYRFQELFGNNRYLILWNSEYYTKEDKYITKELMSFEVKHAAIVSSLIFAMVHIQYYTINPLFLIFIFAFGLILCKTRNDFTSLIPGMIIHGAWNAYIMYEYSLEYNYELLNQFPLIKVLVAMDLYLILIILLLGALVYWLLSKRRK